MQHWRFALKVLRVLALLVVGATVGATVVHLKSPKPVAGTPQTPVTQRRAEPEVADFTALVVSLEPAVEPWSPFDEPDAALYRLTEPSQGVPFDMNADGWRERVAWPAEGTRLAFIVRDVNRNGIVDNGKELERTGSPAPRTRLIGDPALPPAPRVMLWHDENRNGFSERGEFLDLPGKRWSGGGLTEHSFKRAGFFASPDGLHWDIVEVLLRPDLGGIPFRK